MNKQNYIGFDYYSSTSARDVSHGLKNSNPSAIHAAANVLAKIIPTGTNLIPVPSHTGIATHTLLLAMEISKINPGITFQDCLIGNSRQTSYERKKLMLPIDESFYGFKLTENIDLSNSVLLDNVFATGTTIVYAQKAIGSPIPYAVFSKDFSLSLVNNLSVMDGYRTTAKNEKRTVICVLDEFCFVLEEDFHSIIGKVEFKLNKIVDGMSFGVFSKRNLGFLLDSLRQNHVSYALIERL